MRDILYVAIVIAYFGLAALLVAACVRLIGPAESRDPEPRT